MTYARARLWTGITGVGSYVVLASALLATGWHRDWLAGRGGSFFADVQVLLPFLALLALVSTPLEVLGGYVLPKRFGRPHPSPVGFVSAWSRGLVLMLALSAVSGAALLAAGRMGGRSAALALFVLLGGLLLFAQAPLAQLVGGLRRSRRSKEFPEGESLLVLETSDPAFSGGFAGLGKVQVVPEAWLQQLGSKPLAALLERRRRIYESGSRFKAVALALTWNTLGFAFASFLPGAGVSTPGEISTTALGFTLWTFVGLLVLPTPSRRATLAADACVEGEAGLDDALQEAVQVLDRLQDDEPQRATGVERIFHPVPSLTNRLQAKNPQNSWWQGWNLARTALYLSHVGMAPLPRAVHCNVGRPELWVYLPTDG